MTTADRIRERRKEIGISADTLAEKIGVSRSTIFRYESGQIEKMPLNHIEPIAIALNTTAGYLMFGDETIDDTKMLSISSDGELDMDVINSFQKLSPARQHELKRYLHFLLQSEEDGTP